MKKFNYREVAEYKVAGHSYQETAKNFGCSTGTVAIALEECGYKEKLNRAAKREKNEGAFAPETKPERVRFCRICGKEIKTVTLYFKCPDCKNKGLIPNCEEAWSLSRSQARILAGL